MPRLPRFYKNGGGGASKFFSPASIEIEAGLGYNKLIHAEA
jgi:hypothetical protein